MVFYLNQSPPSGYETAYYINAQKLTVNYRHCGYGNNQNRNELVLAESSALSFCTSWSGGWRPAAYSPQPTDNTSSSITLTVVDNVFSSNDYFTIGFYNMDTWGNFYQVGADRNKYYFQN